LVYKRIVTPPRERDHVTLFVPGTPASLVAWGQVLSATWPFAVRSELVANPRDGSFGAAFAFGTCTAEERARIDAAGSALVLGLPVDLHTVRPDIARLARALAASGALAIRIEQSKLGFPIARWIQLVESDDPWALYRLAVVVLGGKTDAATCGMQVFSLPDAHVSLDRTLNASAANALLGVLNVYQIAEAPLLLSGHTFSVDAASPRRELRRWPDPNYPPDDPCHNSFGSWRLGPPGQKPTPPGQLAFVFMPPLVALLTAAEEKKRKPLTQREVEELTKGAVCMTMEHADARALERSRGYADLDPESVWGQWRALRGVS
jgi:hypothetical protein